MYPRASKVFVLCRIVRQALGPVGSGAFRVKDLYIAVFPAKGGTMSTSRAVRDAANPTMTLHDCPLNARVVVDGIDLDDRHRFRLCEIGLAPGTGLRGRAAGCVRRKGHCLRQRTRSGGTVVPRAPSAYGLRRTGQYRIVPRKTRPHGTKRTETRTNAGVYEA